MAGKLYKHKVFYLTSEGLKKLQAELDILIHEKRAESIDLVQKAREFGELPENSELQLALDEQTSVEERIEYLEEVIKDVKLIDHHESDGLIEIGSTVRIQIDKEIEAYTIVGKMEADPMHKKISNESPLGSKLLGAKIGEEVEVITPTFKYSAKILEIS